MSLLEHDVRLQAPEKQELSQAQLQNGIELISPLFDKEISIEPCEFTALHGLMAGHYPISQSDADLRYEIVQSGYRNRAGSTFDERHLGLLLIRRMLETVDLESL